MMLGSLSHSTLIVSVLAFSAACHGPTSPLSPESEHAAGEATTIADAPSSSQETGELGETATAFEEFNCTDVLGVRVRFSHPGYIEGNRVGLYARYEGVPAGFKTLRVWWDRDSDPTSFQDMRLGEGEVRSDNDALFDLKVLVEHVYPPPTAPVDLMVRTELIIEGKTGNCARNRTITIEPPEPDVDSESGSDPCSHLRFCDLGNGTVRDNISGLIWLRQANCLPIRRFVGAVSATAALSDGQCGLTDGSSAGSWRLPTVAELHSLLDPRFTDPQLSNAAGTGQWTEGDAFLGVKNQAHWTSDLQDPCLGPLPGAMVVRIGDGDTRCRITSVGIARFWPVRDP